MYFINKLKLVYVCFKEFFKKKTTKNWPELVMHLLTKNYLLLFWSLGLTINLVGASRVFAFVLVLGFNKYLKSICSSTALPVRPT